MKEFVNNQDNSKWSVAVIPSAEGYSAIQVSAEGDNIETEGWHFSTTNLQEEIIIDRDGVSERIILVKVGDVWWIHHNGHTSKVSVVERGAMSTFDQSGGLTSPMPGKILTVLASVGESVDEGQTLLILEAMKMENRICSPVNGVVSAIYYEAGSQVEQGAILIEIDGDD